VMVVGSKCGGGSEHKWEEFTLRVCNSGKQSRGGSSLSCSLPSNVRHLSLLKLVISSGQHLRGREWLHQPGCFREAKKVRKKSVPQRVVIQVQFFQTGEQSNLWGELGCAVEGKGAAGSSVPRGRSLSWLLRSESTRI